MESLLQCRTLLNKYGGETKLLENILLLEDKNTSEVKKKIKAHKMLNSMIVMNYKKTIELFRRRQDNFMLIQALNELANLSYAQGQLKEAQILWNDSLDTIFQKLYVLNSYQTHFKDVPNLAAKFGIKQCLIGVVVLAK